MSRRKISFDMACIWCWGAYQVILDFVYLAVGAHVSLVQYYTV